MAAPIWKAVDPRIEPGEYVGTVESAVETTSQAGNDMVVWTFVLPGDRRLTRYTLKTSDELHETAEALGLGRRFKLSDAEGGKCILVVDVAKGWNTIERTKAFPVPL